jgi:hypothetical protein
VFSGFVRWRGALIVGVRRQVQIGHRKNRLLVEYTVALFCSIYTRQQVLTFPQQGHQKAQHNIRLFFYVCKLGFGRSCLTVPIQRTGGVIRRASFSFVRARR